MRGEELRVDRPSQVVLVVKNLPANAEDIEDFTWVQSLDQEDPQQRAW